MSQHTQEDKNTFPQLTLSSHFRQKDLLLALRMSGVYKYEKILFHSQELSESISSGVKWSVSGYFVLSCLLSVPPVDGTGFCAVGSPHHHAGHIGQHQQEIPPVDGPSCLRNQEVLREEEDATGAGWGGVHRLTEALIDDLHPTSLKTIKNTAANLSSKTASESDVSLGNELQALLTSWTDKVNWASEYAPTIDQRRVTTHAEWQQQWGPINQ